jgi:sulfur relay (sulfurtransferase) DsrC/TusE family protein
MPGTQANIAQAIRQRGADYLVAVQDNHRILVDSIREFFVQFKAAPQRTPHAVAESVRRITAASSPGGHPKSPSDGHLKIPQ